jgi:hypothetical protein
MAGKRTMADRERREKETLQRNVCRAIAAKTSQSTVTSEAAARYLRGLGIVNGAVERLMDKTTSVQLSTIADLAVKLGVSVSSLFEQDPTAQPQPIEPEPWPLAPQFPAEKWNRLDAVQRGIVAWEANKVADLILADSANSKAA